MYEETEVIDEETEEQDESAEPEIFELSEDYIANFSTNVSCKSPIVSDEELVIQSQNQDQQSLASLFTQLNDVDTSLNKPEESELEIDVALQSSQRSITNQD